MQKARLPPPGVLTEACAVNHSKTPVDLKGKLHKVGLAESKRVALIRAFNTKDAVKHLKREHAVMDAQECRDTWRVFCR